MTISLIKKLNDSAVRALCHVRFSAFPSRSKIDSSWQKRKRTIDIKLIVLFLMKIISGKNNHGYSYIPDDTIKTINKNIISVWEDKNNPKTWKGQRLFAIDGSKLNIPRGLLKDGYKMPKNTTRYYPYAMMSCHL
ncbi:TPA: hypothetical protein ACW0I5_004698 [Escherichia coli]